MSRPVSTMLHASATFFRVVVKRLVEIAEAEHDDSIWDLLFDAEILLAERRGH